jgi:hypothetical protein
MRAFGPRGAHGAARKGMTQVGRGLFVDFLRPKGVFVCFVEVLSPCWLESLAGPSDFRQGIQTVMTVSRAFFFSFRTSGARVGGV